VSLFELSEKNLTNHKLAAAAATAATTTTTVTTLFVRELKL